MDAKRVDKFHKYGRHFYGKLVVVDYTAEVMVEPCSIHNFGRGLPELDQAKRLVAERGYKIKRVLLDIPEYVVEIE